LTENPAQNAMCFRIGWSSFDSGAGFRFCVFQLALANQDGREREMNISDVGAKLQGGS